MKNVHLFILLVTVLLSSFTKNSSNQTHPTNYATDFPTKDVWNDNVKAFAINNDFLRGRKYYPASDNFTDNISSSDYFSSTYTYTSTLDTKGRVSKIVELANPKANQFSGTFLLFY